MPPTVDVASYGERIARHMDETDADARGMLLEVVAEQETAYRALGLLKSLEAVAEGGIGGGTAYGWPRTTVAFVEWCGSGRPFSRRQLENFARVVRMPDERQRRNALRWLELIETHRLDSVATPEGADAVMAVIGPIFSTFHLTTARRQIADFQLGTPQWQACTTPEMRLAYVAQRLVSGDDVWRHVR